LLTKVLGEIAQIYPCCLVYPWPWRLCLHVVLQRSTSSQLCQLCGAITGWRCCTGVRIPGHWPAVTCGTRASGQIQDLRHRDWVRSFPHHGRPESMGKVGALSIVAGHVVEEQITDKARLQHCWLGCGNITHGIMDHGSRATIFHQLWMSSSCEVEDGLCQALFARPARFG